MFQNASSNYQLNFFRSTFMVIKERTEARGRKVAFDNSYFAAAAKISAAPWQKSQQFSLG